MAVLAQVGTPMRNHPTSHPLSATRAQSSSSSSCPRSTKRPAAVCTARRVAGSGIAKSKKVFLTVMPSARSGAARRGESTADGCATPGAPPQSPDSPAEACLGLLLDSLGSPWLSPASVPASGCGLCVAPATAVVPLAAPASAVAPDEVLAGPVPQAAACPASWSAGHCGAVVTAAARGGACPTASGVSCARFSASTDGCCEVHEDGPLVRESP
mmetsp:Transcript_45564/g.142948  ORF Transcript_45564/g.142948 Transcript_45564/m.142948 type:complete len:214 (+) Transcript_45564:109-750(+)